MHQAYTLGPDRARILAAISFHFVEGRIRYLAEVARGLAAFPVSSIDVVVFTNAQELSELSMISSALSGSGLAVEVRPIKNLAHPYELTWAHKELIQAHFLSNTSAFSHFIYLEDDERMCYSNFSYFVEARPLLRHHGLIPSFARTEWRSVSHCYVNTDNERPVVLDKLAHIFCDPFYYVSLDNPYYGAFILDQELAVEYVSSRSFDRLKSGELSGWDIRERAAMGLTFEAVPEPFTARTVVPVDSRTKVIPARAWLSHLPNNYADDPASGFGKIPMAVLLTGAFNGSLGKNPPAATMPAAAKMQIASFRGLSFRGLLNALRAFPCGGRDLVMGFASGYSVATVRPFVESLFTAGAFIGEAVMFINSSDTELRRYLQARGITVVTFNPQAYPLKNLVMARWLVYLDYLNSALERGRSYGNILLTDVRDVIFQKPLFGVLCGEMEFHYEAASPLIGECQWNSLWIRMAFGEGALARFADKRISCAGTVSGQIQGILSYLKQMQNLLLAISDATKQGFGGDQGLHNYIVHSGVMVEGNILDNFRRVATLNYVDGAELGTDESGRVVNQHSQISEIAHQWDRHPHLTAVILATALERQRRSDGQLCWRKRQYVRNIFTRLHLKMKNAFEGSNS